METSMMNVFFITSILLLFTQIVHSRLMVDTRFDRYTHDCDEDFWPVDSVCDPMFTFCLDRPTQSVQVDAAGCDYGYSGESYHFQNSPDITFTSDIGGISNPWKISINTLQDSAVMLAVRTRDDDTTGGDDHMVTYSYNHSGPIYASLSASSYTHETLSIGNHHLYLRIRMYCLAYYYGYRCATYCKASNDATNGYYTCNDVSGDKICFNGWAGPICNQDIDECALNYCARGTCENEPGDYFCHCPEHYTGKNCDQVEDPCNDDPCQHDGSCIWYNTTDPYGYQCSCTSGWLGDNCEIEDTPCVASPCSNDGYCIVTNNTAGFICNCTANYTGTTCETEITTTTVATTTASSASSNESVQTTGAAAPQNGVSDEIAPWIPALICVFLLIVIIIIILVICIVLRRRKRKAKQAQGSLPPADHTVVVFGGDNLAFENSMYNDVNRRNEIQATSIAPTTPSDGELFNPVKPSFCPESLDEEGATGGYQEMDADGYVKPQKSVDADDEIDAKTGLRSFGGLQTQSERARDNPYAAFATLTDSRKENNPEEPHYQDLDEISIAVQGLDKAVKGEEQLVRDSNDDDDDSDDIVFPDRPLSFTYSSATNGGLDFNDPLQNPAVATGFAALEMESSTDGRKEGPYSEIPANTPKNSVRRHEPYTDVPLNTPTSSVRHHEPYTDVPLNTPKNSVHGHEPYADVPLNTPKNSFKKVVPLPPPPPTPPPPPPRNISSLSSSVAEESPYAEPQLKSQATTPARTGNHYAEIPNNSLKRTDPFADDVFEDEDDFNFDLPDVSSPSNFGGNHYDHPSFRRGSEEKSAESTPSTNQYDSPRNSANRTPPDPPAVSDSSPSMSHSAKRRPREYDEVNLSDGNRSEDDLPLAPPPPPTEMLNDHHSKENEAAPEPPTPSESSPSVSHSVKRRPHEYDEVNLPDDDKKSEDDLPTLPPPPPIEMLNDHFDEDDGAPPMSLREGYDFDDLSKEGVNEDGEEELTGKSKEPQLYLENTIFTPDD